MPRDRKIQVIATQILALALENEEARKIVLEKLDARVFPSLLHQKVFYALQLGNDPENIIREFNLTNEALWDTALRFPASLEKLGELILALRSHSQDIEQVKTLENLARNWLKLTPESRSRELLKLFSSQHPSFTTISLSDIQKIEAHWYYLNLPSIKFFPNRYIIIGGRPGAGKTTLAIQIILETLQLIPNINLLIASLELPPARFGWKFLWVHRTMLGNKSFSVPKSSDELLSIELQFLNQSSFIESNFIEDIEDIALTLPPPKLIILDYVQLALSRLEFDNRNAELSYISSKLRNLSKLPDTSVIVCSQLRRRPGVPGLQDLRDSGALEADPDIVIMIREPTPEEAEEIAIPLENISQWRKIITVKDRYDPPQESTVKFEGIFNPETCSKSAPER